MAGKGLEDTSIERERKRTIHALNPSHKEKHVNFNIGFFYAWYATFQALFPSFIFSYNSFFCFNIYRLKHEKNKTSRTELSCLCQNENRICFL